MLTLNIIEANPGAVSVLTWMGVVVLAAVVAMIVAVWLVVARQLARRADSAYDENVEDPSLKALRRLRFLAPRPRPGQATVVAELAPDDAGGTTAGAKDG